MEKSQNGEENAQLNLSNDGSICGYDSLHHLLKDNLKPHHFQVNLLSNQLLIYYHYYISIYTSIFIGSCSHAEFIILLFIIMYSEAKFCDSHQNDIIQSSWKVDRI